MSKKLDEELAQAAGLGDSQDATEAAPPVIVAPKDKPERIRDAPKKTNVGLLATLLVMVASGVGVVLYGFNNAAMYAISVDQLLGEQDARMGRKGRVQGELVPGSLEKRDKPCEYRFKLHGEDPKGQTLSVRYPQCIVPDTFRDAPGGGVQVTVEGKLKSPSEFEATQVMAKCSSKYDPKTHEMGKGNGKTADMPMN